jgi:hypothetical protein
LPAPTVTREIYSAVKDNAEEDLDCAAVGLFWGK